MLFAKLIALSVTIGVAFAAPVEISQEPMVSAEMLSAKHYPTHSKSDCTKDCYKGNQPGKPAWPLRLVGYLKHEDGQLVNRYPQYCPDKWTKKMMDDANMKYSLESAQQCFFDKENEDWCSWEPCTRKDWKTKFQAVKCLNGFGQALCQCDVCKQMAEKKTKTPTKPAQEKEEPALKAPATTQPASDCTASIRRMCNTGRPYAGKPWKVKCKRYPKCRKCKECA